MEAVRQDGEDDRVFVALSSHRAKAIYFGSAAAVVRHFSTAVTGK